MARFFKWFFRVLALLGFLGVAAAVALHQWLGSGDFRTRLEAESAAALGVPVALSRVHISLWPQPAVALDDVQVQTRPPLVLQRVELRPDWRALLAGRREVTSLAIRHAQLPQQGIDLLLAAMHKATQARQPQPAQPNPTTEDAAEQAPELEWLLRHIVLEQVTWRNAQGATTTVDGEAHLDDDGMPRTVTLQVTEGAWKDARLKLERESAKSDAKVDSKVDQWAVDGQLGGGTVQGQLHYRPATVPATTRAATRERELKGTLQTRGVEVRALAAAAGGGQGPLSGQLEASTTLSARATTAAGLADALQTQSKFTVHNAVLHGLDLAKAVTTVGLSRGGETRLSTLSGELATRGRAAQLSELVADSGVLRATGQVALAPSRALSGRLLVDLTAGAAGQLVGVPLAVGGTLEAPEVSLSRGAMLGAAIGTAVLPGVGTSAGARMGDGLSEGVKKLFGK